MLDEGHRRQKAAKILAVLRHFLGRDDLAGLRVLDIGCSAGFIADAMVAAGAAEVIGIDIDVPGLSVAHARFGETISFICGDGSALPLPDRSIDIVVFNHIYEHVVDADAVVAEIHRVLTPTGCVYLGLGNRLGVMEPHYRLPFLSYLPGPLANRYVRAFGRADDYYERFRTRPGLRRMLADFHLWDYTIPVMQHPQLFAAEDIVTGRVQAVPRPIKRALIDLVPTYVWIGCTRPSRPQGRLLADEPTLLG